MKLSYKIFLLFGTFVFFIIFVFFTLNYYVIQRSLNQRAQRDLQQLVESAHTAAQNMLYTAIRNYLRGVVEQDIVVLEQLYGQVQKGVMGEQEAKDAFQAHVIEQAIGKNGYIVALQPEDSRIMIRIHPFARHTDCAFNQGCQDWISQKNGYSEYEWKNPADKETRKKVSYIRYFEPWDWVVGATSYEDEFTQLVKIEDLERFVRPFSVLDQGYFFVLDQKLTVLVHPELKGLSAYNMKNVDDVFVARQMVKNLDTFYYYRWKNPSEKKITKRFAYTKKLEKFNWYLVATGYLEDVNRPIDRLMRMSYALVVLVTILLAGLTLFFSRSLSRPLKELVDGLEAFYREKKVFKMQFSSVTEVEAVGRSIENMTQTLVNSEKQKKDLLDLLDNIINAMPSILVCIDVNGRIILWNDRAAEYSGIPQSRALDQPLMEMLPEFKDIFGRMQTKDRDHPCHSDRVHIQGKNGSDLYFAITRFPLFSGRQSAVIRIDDISERVQMENRLQQSYKMESIGTLAGGIAHDFNNILSAIIGYAELSRMNTPENTKISGYLDKIFKAGNRAKELVLQILTFSRQGDKPKSRPLRVNLLVKEALHLLKASLPSTIEIHANIESRAMVMGDPVQFHQIIMNLCINAGHAMDEKGGILTVSLVPMSSKADAILRHPELGSGPHLQLTISDTGCGIPPGAMARIFDPFFTTKEHGEGTGLGLAVVHGIVKDLNGVIDVKSRPGKGTKFNVFLPEIDAGSTAVKTEKCVNTGGEEHILWVDDEPALVEIGRKILKSLGYRVTTCTRGADALALFEKAPEDYDLVVTDMTMPGMTGDRLAMALCSVRKDIPVILCTGFSPRMTEEKAHDIGIKGFLMKPVVKDEMARMIRKILDAKRHD